MKAIIFLWVFVPFLVVAQERGNINRASGNVNKDAGNANYYNNTYQQPRKYNTQINPLYFDPNGDMIVSVSGLANVKADSYIAIFNLSQIGKTTQEVNELLNGRINQIITKIKTLPNVKTYIDVISFVPVYEYDTEKKVFSKRTYNEIPKGFEMQKNIHIEYTDPSLLENIMSICAEYEVYDLVKVDYHSNNLENIKKEMATKAKAILKEKIKNYQEILSTDLNVGEKQIVDGFQIFYPVDMYKSYQAYSSANLQQNPSKYEIRPATKTTTYYYQPIINEDFDFVMNQKSLEPTIQIVYEIKFKVKKESKAKEYFWLTPNGEAKPLTIGK